MDEKDITDEILRNEAAEAINRANADNESQEPHGRRLLWLLTLLILGLVAVFSHNTGVKKGKEIGKETVYSKLRSDNILVRRSNRSINDAVDSITKCENNECNWVPLSNHPELIEEVALSINHCAKAKNDGMSAFEQLTHGSWTSPDKVKKELIDRLLRCFEDEINLTVFSEPLAQQALRWSFYVILSHASKEIGIPESIYRLTNSRPEGIPPLEECHKTEIISSLKDKRMGLTLSQTQESETSYAKFRFGVDNLGGGEVGHERSKSNTYQPREIQKMNTACDWSLP